MNILVLLYTAWIASSSGQRKNPILKFIICVELHHDLIRHISDPLLGVNFIYRHNFRVSGDHFTVK